MEQGRNTILLSIDHIESCTANQVHSHQNTKPGWRNGQGNKYTLFLTVKCSNVCWFFLKIHSELIIHNNPRYLSTFNITVTRSERRPNKLLFNTHGRISSSLFLHKVGKLWNCLPPAITKLASLPEFKKAVHLHLFNIKFSNTTSSLSF